MFVERTRKEIVGTLVHRAAYDETGLDVKLVRVTSEPVVLGLSTAALKTSARAWRHDPRREPAERPHRGGRQPRAGHQGLEDRSISADAATITVDVAADARPGPRDVSVAGAVKPAAGGGVTVFDKIDGIKILPRAGMARVGGAVFPKQLQQFEAVAYQNGPDGKPNTKDDLSLGLVDVAWKLEEYTATFGDDDLAFVGSLDPVTGLFTPNIDGPNPKRTGERNNVGDVWVVGELAPNAALGTTKPMKSARAPAGDGADLSRLAARAAAPHRRRRRRHREDRNEPSHGDAGRGIARVITCAADVEGGRTSPLRRRPDSRSSTSCRARPSSRSMIRCRRDHAHADRASVYPRRAASTRSPARTNGRSSMRR